MKSHLDTLLFTGWLSISVGVHWVAFHQCGVHYCLLGGFPSVWGSTGWLSISVGSTIVYWVAFHQCGGPLSSRFPSVWGSRDCLLRTVICFSRFRLFFLFLFKFETFLFKFETFLFKFKTLFGIYLYSTDFHIFIDDSDSVNVSYQTHVQD